MKSWLSAYSGPGNEDPETEFFPSRQEYRLKIQFNWRDSLQYKKKLGLLVVIFAQIHDPVWSAIHELQGC
jgi:hypothetical protein